MLRNRFFGLAVTSLLILSGCVSLQHRQPNELSVQNDKSFLRPGLLTSERINAKFGSFGVQVLLQDELSNIRFSNLYSLENGEKITRTLALVNFVEKIDPRLKKTHQEILDGASLGATLTKHGFLLQKNIVFTGVFDGLPPQLNAMMKVPNTEFAATIYEVLVKINNDTVPYCTITEIFSPAFVSKTELTSLHQQFNSNPNEDKVRVQIVASTSDEKVKENLELMKAILQTL